ncbi:TPA: oligosaccharide flippase family protein [Streptococcus suis]|nr:oligosaccharide flippase family protein [Streptococcus suis]HEM3621079.1 oligosaccharide flippase family protein [Streptococcus suis]HEM3651148.1 oligosaccharide flippase family protein [Streptococcus suis]HEM3659511.1 oligosaccharide flippase family protein [Streptococcus suis]
MSSTKKNFVYNSFYQILALIIPFITAPYLSRVLGADGIGKYSYFYSIANYFVLFTMLGINNYGNRTIAKVRDDKKILNHTFWEMYILQFSLGLIFSILYLFYCLFFVSDRLLALTMLPFVISGMLDINWFYFGTENFKLTTIRNTIIKIITTIAIFMLVKSKSDVWIYCLILTGGMLLSQLVVWPYVIRNISFVRPSWGAIKPHIKPNTYLFFTVVAVSIFKLLSKILLGSLSTTVEVGYFELAEKLLIIPLALVTSLGTVMLPRMSNLIAKNSKQVEKTIALSLVFSMFLSTSISFGIMSIAKEFVPLFYGQGFDKVINLIIILLPSCVFLAFANVIRTQYLLPKQMDSVYVISAFLGAGVNLLINYLLIPKYLSLGTAFGTLLTEIVVCVYQVNGVRRLLPIKYYIRLSIPFIIAGIGMFLSLYFLNFSLSIFLVLLIKTLLGILIYCVILSLYIKFIDSEIWRLFRDWRKKTG